MAGDPPGLLLAGAKTDCEFIPSAASALRALGDQSTVPFPTARSLASWPLQPSFVEQRDGQVKKTVAVAAGTGHVLRPSALSQQGPQTMAKRHPSPQGSQLTGSWLLHPAGSLLMASAKQVLLSEFPGGRIICHLPSKWHVFLVFGFGIALETTTLPPFLLGFGGTSVPGKETRQMENGTVVTDSAGKQPQR